MPTPNRVRSRDHQLTKQEILSPVWVGRRTGNPFKAVDDGLEDGIRQITYRSGAGQVYKIGYESFISRFRQATPDDLWRQISETASAPQDGESTSDLVTLIEPDHRHDLDRLVLYPQCREALEAGVRRILNKEAIEAVWHLSQIEPRTNRTALNLYGNPGTGKTMAATTVAKLLGKKLLQVDYSQVASKYVGDTAKHIHAVFAEAAAHNAVLFWDEADALVSRRISLDGNSDVNAAGVNQNRTAVLSALDQFDGVVIFATNFFQNYDEAFLRRIAAHVHFELPNTAMRRRLYELHLPVNDNTAVTDQEWDSIAADSVDFSGGDILNVILNAITMASTDPDPARWQLTAPLLRGQVNAIKLAKQVHAAGAV